MNLFTLMKNTFFLFFFLLVILPNDMSLSCVERKETLTVFKRGWEEK